ncbi:MAG: multicopper oxidase family protein [Myxococcota bacterium]
MSFASYWAVLVLGCCVACGSSGSSSSTPRDWLAEAHDEDPRDDVVRVSLRSTPKDLEIVPGSSTRMLTYSGRVPGPLIRAKRGDLLRVHFENGLDTPATVHWHGVRVPNAMDGVPDVTQPPVQPGAVFDYEFELPDAGLFWYHPHTDSVATLGSGQYGVLLVSDPSEPKELGEEVVLVLSDIGLDDNGQVVPPDADPQKILVGREGNRLLVNGRVYPTLLARSGQRQRWRVLNAARSRYFKLGLSGHTFLRVGADGGLAEHGVEVAEPVIAPGERLDLVVSPQGNSDSPLELMALAHSRGRPLAESIPHALMRIEFSGSAVNAGATPTWTTTLAPIDTSDATEVPIALTVDGADGKVSMGINGVPFGAGEELHAHIDSRQVLAIENKSVYSHPFHLHGYFFQELDDAGQPLRPLLLKDTIDIPPLARRKLAVSYDSRPGMWMFHCHILDHAEAGMMGMVDVMAH